MALQKPDHLYHAHKLLLVQCSRLCGWCHLTEILPLVTVWFVFFFEKTKTDSEPHNLEAIPMMGWKKKSSLNVNRWNFFNCDKRKPLFVALERQVMLFTRCIQHYQHVLMRVSWILPRILWPLFNNSQSVIIKMHLGRIAAYVETICWKDFLKNIFHGYDTREKFQLKLFIACVLLDWY